MIASDECLAPHVPLAQRGHIKLAWHEPFCGSGRARILAWTCDCRATIYELCQAGGQAFIRSTLQSEPEYEMKETYRWPLREARDVWAALLSGEAR
ncbi:hypothetical protein Misp03_02380 [Microbispora sp. NBRC 16548]|nr:hypothetical protein Misp03_02380 [Microbispora sp. NBRC 16548]